MKELPWLNYHHLLYFRTIAQEGGVKKAAARLNLAQSTLSAQLTTLEESLGTRLFKRIGRELELTEAGRVALEYAEEIFSVGDELRSWFAGQTDMRPTRLTIGALSPLSKNLQFEIIRPFIQENRVQVRVVEGEYADLLERLKRHQIDLILSNLPLGGTDAEGVEARLLGEMPMYLVGVPPFRIPKKPFPEWLDGLPVFLPSSRTASRIGFDALMIEAGIQPQIAAEVDDMALLRLLALSGAGLALVPEIGVKFELEEERLLRVEKIPGLNERFYVITMPKRRESILVNEVIATGTRILTQIREGSPGFS